MATTVHDILEVIRESADNNRDRGTFFEHLMVSYLKTDPTYAQQFEEVWMWPDWPDCPSMNDTGIDLVALERDGGYCAIQCKFYEPDHTLSKSDIDSFFTASGKAAFTSRMIISTTDKWGSNAEEALKSQLVPVSRLGLADIADSPIDWGDIRWTDLGVEVRLEPGHAKALRPHQEEALEDVFAGFAKHDRGKLIMACGTGKTFTSLKIAERLAVENTSDQTTVLFLVPSISLLSQSLREWATQCQIPMHSFAVCSDAKASRQVIDADGQDMSAVDLAFPATTNSAKLLAQMSKAQQDGAGTMSVIFSTYQSIDAVAAAQKAGLPDFDLIICDEAHRTTGVTLSGQDESAFVKVHNNDFLRADRRLYMTATPRLYDDATQTNAKLNNAALISMGNESMYGPEFHRLGFGKAVSAGLLTDYKVLILTVDESIVAKSMQAQFADENSELNIGDVAKIVGCWNGLAKRPASSAKEDSFFKPGEPPMQRAVAFARNIAESKKLTDLFAETISQYDGADEDVLRCEVQHVDGTFNSLRRNQKLNWLKADPGEHSCRILSNARCLSEGVDVPDLDAVLFLHPRNSVVDVVQSVGRVMRRAEGKDFGYIILPVGVPADMTPEQALADNQRFKVVWQVLQALRAHDDRFNATVNQLDLNKKRPDNILVGHAGGDGDGAAEGDGTESAEQQAAQQLSLALNLDEWRDAIYAKIVTKVGERHYWENWAKDIAQIAERHVARINAALDDPTKRAAFEKFVVALRSSINPGVTEPNAIDMLAQHLITKPVFDALFAGYEFSTRNPVSLAMQQMLDVLDDQVIGREAETLEGFYNNVRVRAEGIDNHQGRQQVITELYEKFFKTALPKTVEAFGIVYTPIPVVDFMLRATAQALRKHFDVDLSDQGVHVLDPFTGTGTFIVRLLQSGLIKSEDLLRKYTSEIHANEIVLLAYYIAAVNIEAAFHQEYRGDYQPFNGIVLTDTFQLNENDQQIDIGLLMENSERVKRQKRQDIRVILGNPPYSVGQGTQNDANQNQKYPILDSRIRGTYAEQSTAKNKNSLYDSYIRAIRWSSDRIKTEGIICFVSNGGYVDNNTADGLRKSLAEEFDTIYCYNLRGNQKADWKREGGKIFGSGSQNTIAIIILIKGGRSNGDGRSGELYYRDIGDYLTRDEKLAILAKQGLESVEWECITPTSEGDWINQRDGRFQAYTPLTAEGSPGNTAIFSTHTRGLETGRDAWAYNFSSEHLRANIKKTISFYNNEVDRYIKSASDPRGRAIEFSEFVSRDSNNASWTASLFSLGAQQQKIRYTSNGLRYAVTRPFTRQYVYLDSALNHRQGKIPQLFPDPQQHSNVGFYITGKGSDEPFSVLMFDRIPDLHAVGTKSVGPLFARYSFRATGGGDDLFSVAEEPGFERVDNITDTALHAYQAVHGNDITKDDIFHYVYGVLHSPHYRQAYAADLKRSLPHVPHVRTFHEFTAAGRRLADLHLGYETVKPYPLDEKITGMPASTLTDLADTYRVQKMRLRSKTDRSTIVYNSRVTLSGIPEDAYRYQLGARSAIEWIIDRYQVTTHKDSGIVNDPNNWSDDPRYIIDLLKRVVTVSVETMKIVDSLPPLEIIE